MNREDREYKVATEVLLEQYKMYLNEKVNQAQDLSQEDKEGILKAMPMLETIEDFDNLAIQAGIEPYRIKA